MSSHREDVKARIDAIEQSYEFFLAYAAQGLSSDQGSRHGGQLRDFLARLEASLDGLAEVLKKALDEGGAEPAEPWAAMAEVVGRDAGAALAAVRLVSAQPGVGSQLIDNLNANVHLRALLTDLFIVDDLIDA